MLSAKGINVDLLPFLEAAQTRVIVSRIYVLGIVSDRVIRYKYLAFTAVNNTPENLILKQFRQDYSTISD